MSNRTPGNGGPPLPAREPPPGPLRHGQSKRVKRRLAPQQLPIGPDFLREATNS